MPFCPGGQQGTQSAATQGAQLAGVYAGPTTGPQPVATRPTGATRTTPLPRRQLTATEMAQSRAEGLCFKCPEKYFAGHRCKQLTVIEIVPDDAEEEEPPSELPSTKTSNTQ